jgi:hypothetical protein
MSRSPVRAKQQITLQAHLRGVVFFRKRPAPRKAIPGRGNQSAAPPVRFAEPVLTVVMVRVDVTEPPAVKEPDGAPSEQVGGFVAELTEHARVTAPAAPVEATVTVEVPVPPRVIAFGEIVPALTEN